MVVADRSSLKLFNLFTIKNIPIKLCPTSKSVPGLIPAPAPSPYFLSLPEAVISEVAISTVFRSVVQLGVASATAKLSDDVNADCCIGRLSFWFIQSRTGFDQFEKGSGFIAIRESRAVDIGRLRNPNFRVTVALIARSYVVTPCQSRRTLARESPANPGLRRGSTTAMAV